MKVKIIATGSYLPNKIVLNDEIAKKVNTSDEWIQSRTGILSRHIAEKEQLTSDLATHALKNALQKYSLKVSELDAIIVATTTPDLIFPATSVKVQQNIEMKHGFAFDLQAVCSGFIYALAVAKGIMYTQNVKTIAVIGAEVMSKIMDWNDRNTCVLFGDGAGAVILQKDETKQNQSELIDTILYSKAELYNILRVEGGIAKGGFDAKILMEGKEVFKHAVIKMSELTLEILKKNNYRIENVNWLLPHQANIRIIESIGERLQLKYDKIMTTLKYHANTSAASIPLTLDHYNSLNMIKKGDLIALASAGAGMTFSSALIRW